MVLIRKLVFVMLKFNICIKAVYLDTKSNYLNDAISRFDKGITRILARYGMKLSPEKIPAHLLPEAVIPP